MMRGHPTEPEPHHWQAFSRGRSLFPTLLRASWRTAVCHLSPGQQLQQPLEPRQVVARQSQCWRKTVPDYTAGEGRQILEIQGDHPAEA
jgi:hypothetical protein